MVKGVDDGLVVVSSDADILVVMVRDVTTMRALMRGSNQRSK